MSFVTVNLPKAPEPFQLRHEETVNTPEEAPQEDIPEENDNPESAEVSKPQQKPERMETDQEKMVLELFDGKYIE